MIEWTTASPSPTELLLNCLASRSVAARLVDLGIGLALFLTVVVLATMIARWIAGRRWRRRGLRSD